MTKNCFPIFVHVNLHCCLLKNYDIIFLNLQKLGEIDMAVHFYESVEDSLLKFAVIVAKYHGQYVFCKHKDRDTLEVAGGTS